MSLTFTLTGKSSVLAVSYFPAVDLNDSDYELDLTDFETYHTIPNVISSNNNFILTKTTRKLSFPKNRMNCDSEKYLKRANLRSRPNDIAKKKTPLKELNEDNEYKERLPLMIHANNNTMKSEIMSAYRTNFIKHFINI